MAISALLSDMWSVTGFSQPELDAYAERQIRSDTRLGIQLVALLCALAQVAVGIFVFVNDPSQTVLKTNLVVGALSIHVLFSAAYIEDVRTLHLLGMVFLVISALAITFLAHRLGDLSTGMIAAMAMLIVTIPLIPWALREALVVIFLTYMMLTMSLISVPDRFEPHAFRVLQMLLLGAAVVAMFITGRNTRVRKQDIRARFELERAHGHMELLSKQDHLTGAWNRRYLEDEFSNMVDDCHRQNRVMQIAVLDVDDFKGINDQFGHLTGDRILVEITGVFIKHLGDSGCLVRLGGDEFQILFCGEDLDALINRAVDEVQRSAIAQTLVGQRDITLSAGIVSTNPAEPAELDELYRRADRALYAAKKHRRPARQDLAEDPTLGRTGTWKL